METAPAPLITHTSTAAEQVAEFLQHVPEARHEQALRAALQRQKDGQKSLADQHLSFVEQGWEDSWQSQYTNKTDLVAEITRVLAERFGV